MKIIKKNLYFIIIFCIIILYISIKIIITRNTSLKNNSTYTPKQQLENFIINEAITVEQPEISDIIEFENGIKVSGIVNSRISKNLNATLYIESDYCIKDIQYGDQVYSNTDTDNDNWLKFDLNTNANFDDIIPLKINMASGNTYNIEMPLNKLKIPNRRPSAPTIDYWPLTSTIKKGENVILKAKDSVDEDGDNISYIWEGRNAETSTYDIGTHTVKVKAIDEWGAESDWTTYTFTVINIEENDYYEITKKLGEGISIDNEATKAKYNEPYNATIKALEGYQIGDIVVKMGGKLITVDKTTGIINIENVIGDIEIIAIAGNGAIAVGDTNTDTGEVTLNLEKYVDQAESGDTIYIPAGEYKLAQINSYHSYANQLQCGINDKGKSLTFVGENEKTKLIYYGGESNKRDGNPFMCLNSTTIIRNMIIEFYPGKGYYTSNALFSHTYGNVYNTFFIVKNANQPTCYGYNNRNYLNVNIENCDIYFEDTSLVNASYFGWDSSNYGMKFNNIVSNYLPREYTSINNGVECDINENIEDTKNNEDIVNNGVGVYFGNYAWK